MNDPRHEGGAVAVVVAIFLAFVVMALAAVTIDIGSLWQSQRNLVTNTDAMALGGASFASTHLLETEQCPPDSDVHAEIESLREANNINDELTDDPVIECDSSAYRVKVRVDAEQPSPGFFSGEEDLRAPGTTTAVFEILVPEAEGLALCKNWFDGVTEGDTVTVGYRQANESMTDLGITACEVDHQLPDPSAPAANPGNWGWLDGSCGDGTLDGLLANPWCDGETGNKPQMFDDWIQVDTEVVFPLYTEALGPGGNAEFLISGFATAIVEGYSGTGQDECNQNYFTAGQGNNPRCITLTVEKLSSVEEPATFENLLSICDVGGTETYCPSFD